MSSTQGLSKLLASIVIVGEAIDGREKTLGNLADCGYILAATIHHYPLHADSTTLCTDVRDTLD
jgi:hypothetical protein